MRHRRIRKLGDLQLQVLQALWGLEEASVEEIHGAVNRRRSSDEPAVAYNTVGTVLSRLEEAELVGHRTEGRRYLYRPLASRGELRNRLVEDLVDRAFGGDPAALFGHLLGEADLDADELAELQARIRKAEEAPGSGPASGDES